MMRWLLPNSTKGSASRGIVSWYTEMPSSLVTSVLSWVLRTGNVMSLSRLCSRMASVILGGMRLNPPHSSQSHPPRPVDPDANVMESRKGSGLVILNLPGIWRQVSPLSFSLFFSYTLFISLSIEIMVRFAIDNYASVAVYTMKAHELQTHSEGFKRRPKGQHTVQH